MAHGNTVLVLGASGGIGGEVARQLRDEGWQVHALKRDAAPVPEVRLGITWHRGDAMHADDVATAAKGCSAIVHAVNPPGYRRWGELVLPMLDHTIAAAEREGATIVLPGTVYNYGPDVFALISEDAPQRPLTRKGAIRVEMERRLQVASAGRCRVIIVRAGDFFGPRSGNSWFSQAVVKPGKAVTAVQLPGDPGVGHQWAYLPDVARTMVELLALRHTLPAFARFHMAGHWDADGMRMGVSIQDAALRAGMHAAPKLRRFPWWQVRLAAPWVPTLRELLEMRYLWQQEVRLDNRRLLAVLGREPHTPWDQAVRATLAGMGCIGPPAPPDRQHAQRA
ncbi:NAD-dependent epimerase/dehydratase family protein [Caldimonas brevitalea]|uniref:Membrane protein n=1 Tax=Caldimonas brevitalea TaxID=413882 RepID=A0A0G3BS83_9BURK|nr:NAD-dependent epimerase/dehydratase family protein [Caldimonas brevitalea]AKJ29405.1 membrane protein [Caldimonas brevitalea]